MERGNVGRSLKFSVKNPVAAAERIVRKELHRGKDKCRREK